jgi:hypothetical protein
VASVDDGRLAELSRVAERANTKLAMQRKHWPYVAEQISRGLMMALAR